jgi:hypothetical protein
MSDITKHADYWAYRIDGHPCINLDGVRDIYDIGVERDARVTLWVSKEPQKERCGPPSRTCGLARTSISSSKVLYMAWPT